MGTTGAFEQKTTIWTCAEASNCMVLRMSCTLAFG